jgi:ABC-type polysaccharide/polyol phosphate transport system ATPase subunit
VIGGGSYRIACERAGKRFRLGVRHGSLGALLPALARGLLGRRDGQDRTPFWALRDVSFTVEPGTALGIIGPNGSGKSTMLKLLAGILRADEGRVAIEGPSGRRARIGSLIELAAGFHYELTGRENVYLQGAVLGMRRAEIARKFDEIVSFAEVEAFLDTPVKHYSSGMVARLGFSISAHLDPDVLLIDEVLAVGDFAFQRKAFARLREAVRGSIPTVVVTHQLHRITEVCDQCILLAEGRVLAAGSTAECIATYVGDAAPDGPLPVSQAMRLDSISAPEPPHVSPGGRVRIVVRGEVTEKNAARLAAVGLRVRSLPGEEVVFTAHSAGSDVVLPASGPFELEIDVAMNVGPGVYRAQAVAWDTEKNRELTRGPATIIGVEKALGSSGRVFGDPRIRLLSP